MLTKHELRTICAALQFWEEEMCPHPNADFASYFPAGENTTMTAQQIAELRQRLASCELRYGVVESATGATMIRVLAGDEMAEQAASWVTILVPPTL